MDTPTTLRILAATAVVSALAVLMTSPAQARWVDDSAGAVPTTPSVGNPGDSAWIALEQATAAQTIGNPGDGASASATRIEGPLATSAASDGFDTGTFVVVAGGAVLLLGAGALLFTARHRRVALP